MLEINTNIKFDFYSIIKYVLNELVTDNDYIMMKSNHINKVSTDKFIKSLNLLINIHNKLNKFDDIEFMNTYGVTDCKFIPSNGLSTYGDILEFCIEFENLTALIKRDSKFTPDFYIKWMKFID